MDARSLPPESLRRLLVRAAAAVRSQALDQPLPEQPCEDPVLLEQRPVFVALHRGGELAGCIGYLQAQGPLWELVATAARLAASEDERFDPVHAGQLPLLEIEVSVLTEPSPIEPHALEPGRHGLVLSTPERRSVLLPQVAITHRLDGEAFLAALCDKARLPAQAWTRPDAELLGFELDSVQAPWSELDEPDLRLSGGM